LLNPSDIARMIARIEPITVIPPLIPQAHGTNSGACSTTTRSPRGKKNPRAVARGATVRSVTAMRWPRELPMNASRTS
jgi:hypothetical protein